MDPKPEIVPGGWWICGDASYTIPILPSNAQGSMGFVYALLFSNGLVKIGHSAAPRQRIQCIASSSTIYGEVKIEIVALSHPLPNYAEVERSLHDEFSECRIRGELFDCQVAKVGFALLSIPLPEWPNRKNLPGPNPKPWYWSQRKAWFTNIRGKRTYLGKDQVEATAALGRIIAETA